VPFSAQQSFECPTSLSGLQQQAGQEVLESCSYILAPLGNKFPTILSTREISYGPNNPPLQYPMGLTNRFFSPTPKLTSYTNKYGYGYGLRYNDMKVRRIYDYLSEFSWYGSMDD
jgi:hypothetical protein